MDKQFITLKLSAIKPYPNNPRINDDAVQYVIKSIEECENLDPIEVDEDNVILSGHTRLKALKKLGYKQTECIRYTGLTDEQKRKYRLLANKTGEFAEWDMDLLRQELDDIIDIDMSEFGFDLVLDDNENTEKEKHAKLTDKFGVPPFSIFDTRQGYWQERKKAWKELGIKSEDGRDANTGANYRQRQAFSTQYYAK